MPKNEFICDCAMLHEDVVAHVRAQMPTDALCQKGAAFFKLLGDATRMKILSVLAIHELCVCDIANLLSMTKSAVSHQLALLKGAGFVRFRREGKAIYYSLDDEHVSGMLALGIKHIQHKELG